jgi:hypothetical protein
MLVACRAELRILSGREPFISTVTGRIPFFAFMELMNHILSAWRFRAAASRLVNQDIIDLYNRVPVGAPVVVLQT